MMHIFWGQEKYISGFSYCYTLVSFFHHCIGWLFVCAKDSSRFVTYFGYCFALQFIRNKLVQKLDVKTKSAKLLTYIFHKNNFILTPNFVHAKFCLFQILLISNLTWSFSCLFQNLLIPYLAHFKICSFHFYFDW